MKLPHYNPFFHDEPIEFDVKYPKGERRFNMVFAGAFMLSLAVWVAVFWLADCAIRGGF